MKKVLIIGGGVIGQFSAYYLSKSGHQVTIVDDKPKMTPASEGNCALVTPSHIIPLNSFNAIFQGIKWLGKKDAPLKIKPQLDRRFMLWFLNFMRYSHSAHIEKATHARHALLQQSFKLYESFFQEEPNESQWRKGGLLYACRKPESIAQFSHEIELHRKFGMDNSRMLSKDEILAREPLLKSGVVGGVIMEMDGWLNPGQLLQDLKRINEGNGVTYVRAKAESFAANNSGIQSIKTDQGEIEADEFVLSAGALSPLLTKKLNIKIPVIPGKGYNLTTLNESFALKQPVYMVERKVVATSWEKGLRIGSTMEFAGYNLDLTKTRLEALRRAASEYLEIDIESLEMKPWAGWRPMKDNGIPIIEKSKIKNLTIATGHSMVGLSMAPATGFIVNELISMTAD
ncbi:MAG: FAD-dependent oxidoreductase [Cyclobacteriaceae bacterium]